MSRPKGHKAYYNARVANRICEGIAEGLSLKKVLDREPLGPNMMSIYRWLDEHPAFREKYDRARMLQADVDADAMRDLAIKVIEQPKMSSAIRVAADILQWQASMRNPRLYGNKVTVESKNTTLKPAEVKAEIERLEKELNVDSESTAKSRDASEREPAAQPDPIVLEPSLYDAPVGPLQ